MTIPDFTGIDLGASNPAGEWGPGPEVWESPEGIAVKPLYTAADLSGVDALVAKNIPDHAGHGLDVDIRAAPVHNLDLDHPRYLRRWVPVSSACCL